MRNLFKTLQKAALLALFTFLTTAMLLESEMALELSLNGLNLWFQKMIPTLLPFMILSGILIRMNLSDSFARLFSPILRPLFGLSDACLYVLVVGFLCGFPMGARVTAESLRHGRITRREASLLLAFCNNIGPIYFTGFVLHLFPVPTPLPYLAGMYLLPLLYGLFLRHTFYRDIPLAGKTPDKLAGRFHMPFSGKASAVQTLPSAVGRLRKRNAASHIHAASIEALSKPSLLAHTQDSILSSLIAIASLGGYMILFNLMNLIPELLLPRSASLSRALCACLLEITSGLSRLPATDAFWAFVLLPFGGLSCIAQTYSMISDTGLSLNQYVFHKWIQTLLAFLYYSSLPRLLP